MKRSTVVAAVHLLLIKENKILLLRRFNTGYEDGNYSVCAGHIEDDELFYNAMIREAKEEIGIIISQDNLKPIQVMHRRSDEERIDYFFTASNWEGEIKNMEPNKCDELEWFEFDNLPNNIIPYIKHAIIQYQNGTIFTDFGW